MNSVLEKKIEIVFHQIELMLFSVLGSGFDFLPYLKISLT